jgi:hypothetical protein
MTRPSRFRIKRLDVSRPQPSPINLESDRLLTTAQASRLLGVSQKTLRELRREGRGPTCFKRGFSQQARVHYPLSALNAYANEMLRRGGRGE